MNIITISAKANPNYLAKVFLLTEDMVSKHSNADKLSIVTVDFTPVISNSPQVDSWYVYFPTESKLQHKFLSFANLYRDCELNKDTTQTGFVEKNSRVKTIKLRGEYSSGMIIPLKLVEDCYGVLIPKEEKYFDTITVGEKQFTVITKYMKVQELKDPQTKGKSGTNRKVEDLHLQENSFQFHNDTEQIKRNWFKVHPEAIISVTAKLHGSSAILAKLPTVNEQPKKWYHKLFKLNPKVEHGFLDVFSSRKVIKNLSNKAGFYETDIWLRLHNDFKDVIPEGYTVYGEVIGYQENGSYIQNNYDYKCKPTQYEFMPYRITSLDLKGNHIELSASQVNDFSSKVGMRPMHIYFTGLMKDHFYLLALKQNNQQALALHKQYVEVSETLASKKEVTEQLQKMYIELLCNEYTEKDCEFCNNSVPEEGVIIRIEKYIHKFEAFKLKSLRFLTMETTENDKGLVNIEDQESMSEPDQESTQ